MKRILIVIASTIGLAGCASPTSTSSDFAVVRLTEGGAQVQILRSEAITHSCVNLGEVKAYPPYVLPDDGRNTMRNKAAELGADAIFVTNYLIAPATAIAYRCLPPQPSQASKHRR